MTAVWWFRVVGATTCWWICSLSWAACHDISDYLFSPPAPPDDPVSSYWQSWATWPAGSLCGNPLSSCWHSRKQQHRKSDCQKTYNKVSFTYCWKHSLLLHFSSQTSRLCNSLCRSTCVLLQINSLCTAIVHISWEFCRTKNLGADHKLCLCFRGSAVACILLFTWIAAFSCPRLFLTGRQRDQPVSVVLCPI